jgi:hypothetical protein
LKAKVAVSLYQNTPNAHCGSCFNIALAVSNHQAVRYIDVKSRYGLLKK